MNLYKYVSICMYICKCGCMYVCMYVCLSHYGIFYALSHHLSGRKWKNERLGYTVGTLGLGSVRLGLFNAVRVRLPARWRCF